MKFADFVSREAVRADLTADDKESVIREMTQALLDAGKDRPSESMKESSRPSSSAKSWAARASAAASRFRIRSTPASIG